jgi:Na+/proline symporter
VVNATAAILTLDIYVPLINPAATERQKVRFGIWASLAAIIAGIAMAIAISHMDAGIYQYMQTINALVAPPFAAILWVGLLWKRTNGAGAIAAIIAGFATGIGLKLIGYAWTTPPGPPAPIPIPSLSGIPAKPCPRAWARNGTAASFFGRACHWC